MPSFRYRAMTPSGAIVTGVLDAVSEPAAIEEIRARGHYPIEAAHGSAAARASWREVLGKDILPRRRFSPRALVVATQELAALLQAGLELDRALEILVNLDESKPMRETFTRIQEQVRGGMAFADALGEQAAFPKFYVNIVRAGEQGGDLQAALEQLGEYLGRSLSVREAVISALIYPLILLATAGISIVVVLVFVLPSFEPLFAEAGKALPPETRIVMATGHFVTTWSWAILLGLLALVVGLRRALKDAAFKRRWDGLLLRLPLIGGLLAKIDIERFSRTLGTLLKNGVALPQALVITGDTLANSVIAGAVSGAAAGLKEGDVLSSHLRAGKAFPRLALDMMRVGEESGQLDGMLLRQADLYEREIKHTIDRLVALLVPCLTIFMGLIVAGLIGSILVAILSVNDLAI
ncbi:MAG TPA: type II secretion system F family protein [Rhizomicrobium sp.]|jgi:general secretion pathway protein F|nr:type II secretion system F family protein [Rhizomicrobium sp.]